MEHFELAYYFAALIIVEYVYNAIKRKPFQSDQDTVTSVSVAIPSFLIPAITPAFWITVYYYLQENIVPYQLSPESWWVFVLGIVAMDFVSYWYHRYFHATNLTWSVHVVHHSAEEFNFSTGFRGPFTERIIGILSGAMLLYVLPVFIGLPLEAAIFGYLVRDLWGFACHTQNIRRLGFLEYLLVTPSHHRVHHAMNDRYIDKNYGFVFIIWDKMFGTFVAEDDKEPVIFGVRKPPRSWDVITVSFHELFAITKASMKTSSWWDKIKIWFMPPGWLPKDITQDALLITTPMSYRKYEKGRIDWPKRILANIQLAITVLGAVHLGLTAPDHSLAVNVLYFLFIFINTVVTGFTLEGRVAAIWLDLAKLLFLVSCFILVSWFGREPDMLSHALSLFSLSGFILLLWLKPFNVNNDLQLDAS